MPSFITIEGPNLNTIISNFNKFQQGKQSVDNAILSEVSNTMYSTAKQNSHVITRQTQGSIESRVVGNDVILSAGFGAPYEEKRGKTPSKYHSDRHDFLTLAIEDIDSKMSAIIKKHYDNLIR